MTTKLLPFLLLMSLVIVSGACSKENPEEKPEVKLPQYLLKTIAWDYGLTANLSYNQDSTLSNIDYSFQSTSGRSTYSWAGKTLTEFYSNQSLYKNVFEYDKHGRVVKMRNIAKTGSVFTGYLFEFHYNALDRVDSLNYFTVNIAGKQLQASTVYHYNSAGEIKEAVTLSGNSTITHTINEYSPPVSYHAYNYIGTSLDENYIIYNYAVMTQLNKTNKLPAKITRVIKNSSQPASLDKIEAHVYTITNHRIDKVVTTISFPATPVNNRTLESVYSYF